MFRKPQPSAKTLLLLTPLLLLPLLVILTTHPNSPPQLTHHSTTTTTTVTTTTDPPRPGTISPLLHSQNLSHGSFHNPFTKPYLLALVTTSPGQPVVIIGLANGGEALAMSRTHAVHAVEPMAAYIKRFRSRGGGENVTLYNVAASDENGVLEVSYNGLKDVVQARRVEEVLPRGLHAAVVSVDIQGEEYKALKGLGGLLESANSVWVEVGCKDGVDVPLEMLSFLDNRFALFDFVPWGKRAEVEQPFDRRQFYAGRRPDDIGEWVRWFCDGRKAFKWLQTDVVAVSRALLNDRPEVLDGLRMVAERNCAEGCFYRDAVNAAV